MICIKKNQEYFTVNSQQEDSNNLYYLIADFSSFIIIIIVVVIIVVIDYSLLENRVNLGQSRLTSFLFSFLPIPKILINALCIFFLSSVHFSLFFWRLLQRLSEDFFKFAVSDFTS